MLYRQLPARSPIPGAAFPSLLRALVQGDDARPQLQATLETEFGAHAVILCASGTHALQIALLAIKQKYQGRTILLPAYTCYEVATAAIGAGVPVTLYDINPDTLEPDWDVLRTAARQGAAAVLVAPLFGMPLDWAAARSICDDAGTILIEDAAQAHGSTWQERAVGSLGDLSILSFGRGKGWTGGGGGALLWRGAIGKEVMSATDAARHTVGSAREAKSWAAAAAQWLLARPRIYGLPASLPILGLGETIYHPPTPPRGMSRTAAALLIASKAAADADVSHRRGNAKEYARSITAATDAVTSVIGGRADANSGALRFPLRRRGGWGRLHLTAAPSLGAAPGYPTSLQQLPALRPSVTNASDVCPGAELLASELVTLPTHGGVTMQERRNLIEIVMAE